MANLPPPNHVADLHEDEPVHPEHTPIVPDHVPAQPKGYISDDDIEEDPNEEPKEEPEQEPEFAPFAQAAQNNMNEVEIDDDEDDAEVIYPYEEAYPLNRPPPDSNIEPEAVAAAPTLVGCATLQPLPPIRRFSGKNLDTLHSKVKSLARQTKDRSDNEIKIQKKFKHSDLRMNSFDYDLSTLDLTLREQILKNSKMMQLFTELSNQFQKYRKEEDVRAENIELKEMPRNA
ncbi:hypothetical protein Tco_0114655 [Tanacetum coccineum]